MQIVLWFVQLACTESTLRLLGLLAVIAVSHVKMAYIPFLQIDPNAFFAILDLGEETFLKIVGFAKGVNIHQLLAQ